MSIGIYSLYWKEPDLIYIGQGNLTVRHAQHISSCRLGKHCNYKIQATYNRYGPPEFLVLEATDTNLDILEQEYIKEFDSIRNGLNILPGGKQMSGLNHPRAKYSKMQILRAFILLLKSKYTYLEISKRTGINASVVPNIANGKTHSWIKSTYPEHFNNMQINRKIRGGTRASNPIVLVDPDGTEHLVTNIADFCRNHPVLKNNWKNEASMIGKVVRGERGTHKGIGLK